MLSQGDAEKCQSVCEWMQRTFLLWQPQETKTNHKEQQDVVSNDNDDDDEEDTESERFESYLQTLFLASKYEHQGDEHANVDDYASALRDYQAALELEQNSTVHATADRADLHIKTARSYKAVNQNAQAIFHYRRAICIYMSHRFVYVGYKLPSICELEAVIRRQGWNSRITQQYLDKVEPSCQYEIMGDKLYYDDQDYKGAMEIWIVA